MRSRGSRTRRARGHHVCRKTHHSKLSRCSGRTGRSKGTSRWIGSDRFGSQNCRYRRRRVACARRRGTGLPLPYRGRSQRSAGKQSVGHASAAPKTGRGGRLAVGRLNDEVNRRSKIRRLGRLSRKIRRRRIGSQQQALTHPLNLFRLYKMLTPACPQSATIP